MTNMGGDVNDDMDEGGTSAARDSGYTALTRTNNKSLGLSKFRGMTRTIPDPEALDTLMDILQHASVSEEHHTMMGTVVERVWSMKSGLNEAFTSLLRGSKVRNVIFSIVL